MVEIKQSIETHAGLRNEEGGTCPLEISCSHSVIS